MRCPKCHYLSFDPEPRCRNCGYGLSLEDGDLFIRDHDTAPAPLADLSLRPSCVSELENEPRRVGEAARAVTVTRLEPELAVEPLPVLGPNAAADSVVPPPTTVRSAPTTELPLFVKALSTAVDEPLVTVPPEPRPPLSVRRKTHDAPVSRPRPAASGPRKLGPLDRDLLADLQRIEKQEQKEAEAEQRAATRGVQPPDRVGAAKRLAAAVVDAVFLGTIGAVILWATLRWTDLPVDRALMVPVLAPTGMFVMLLGIVYLLLFTAAGGQTLGKMALGLRVVDDEPSPDAVGPLTVGQALARAVLTVPSVLVAGAGFVPALVGDERAVHDRLARTRVVRA